MEPDLMDRMANPLPYKHQDPVRVLVCVKVTPLPIQLWTLLEVVTRTDAYVRTHRTVSKK